MRKRTRSTGLLGGCHGRSPLGFARLMIQGSGLRAIVMSFPSGVKCTLNESGGDFRI